MEFITQMPWAMTPSLQLGATKGLRVIHSVDLGLLVTTKQCKNVAVISSNITW